MWNNKKYSVVTTILILVLVHLVHTAQQLQLQTGILQSETQNGVLLLQEQVLEILDVYLVDSLVVIEDALHPATRVSDKSLIRGLDGGVHDIEKGVQESRHCG